jgi:hypothetical protein
MEQNEMINSYLKDLNPAKNTGHTYGTPSNAFVDGYKSAIKHVTEISFIKRSCIQKAYFNVEAQEKIEVIQAERAVLKVNSSTIEREQDKIAMGGNPAQAASHRSDELKGIRYELLKKADQIIFLKDLCNN